MLLLNVLKKHRDKIIGERYLASLKKTPPSFRLTGAETLPKAVKEGGVFFEISSSRVVSPAGW
jgi:hypothetical protein